MKFAPQQLALLDQIETQLAQFSAALLINQTGDMSRAAAVLQTLVVGLTKTFQQGLAKPGHDPALSPRLKKIAAALAAQRESLLRHTVQTERALAALMPGARTDTYTAPASNGGYGKRVFGGYGGTGRQSGEFKMTAA